MRSSYSDPARDLRGPAASVGGRALADAPRLCPHPPEARLFATAGNVSAGRRTYSERSPLTKPRRTRSERRRQAKRPRRPADWRRSPANAERPRPPSRWWNRCLTGSASAQGRGCQSRLQLIAGFSQLSRFQALLAISRQARQKPLHDIFLARSICERYGKSIGMSAVPR